MINIDIKKLKLSNGKTLEQQMKFEAKRFIKILQDEIDNWYASYTPTIYERTYEMRDSIFAEDFVSVNAAGTKLIIKIKQTDEAMHPSLWEDYEPVNALLLMDRGYKVEHGWHKQIPYFGYRDAGNFIDAAINRFNRDNELGIEIQKDF